MLYANLNIAGAGGFSIVSGQTYLEITNQALYFDAAGSVLGLDGDGTPAGLDLSANMYLAVQFGEAGSGFDEYLMQGGFRLSISIPFYMSGDGTLDFFAGRVAGDPVVWGVQGDFHIDILSLLDGNITFLASDVGFYFEGGLGVGFSVFIFSFQSDLDASVWYVRDPVAMGSTAAQEYPAGGYATARVEFCAFKERGCLGADAVGAFVRQSQGFKVLAGASVSKLSGHIIVTSDGDISAHTGGVEDNPAILAAQSLKDDFESYLDDLVASLAAAEQAVQESLQQRTYDPPDEALIANAGYNLIAGSPWFRSNWAGYIRSNEQNSSGFFPPALNGQLSWVEALRTQNVRDGTFKVTTQQNISDLTSGISQVSGTVLAKLDALMLEAIEIEQQIQQVYADFLDDMEESPVESWSLVSPGNYQSESPSFQINMDQAAQQAQQAENLDQVMSEMGLAMIEPLQQVEALLADVDSAMFEQDESQAVDIADIYFHPDPSVMGFARMYESAIQIISGYKVNQATILWVKADWATQWRTHFDQNQSQRDNAIQLITDALIDMDNSDDGHYDERVVTGNRLQMIYQLDNKDNYFRAVNSWGSVDENARNYFLGLTEADPADIKERNRDFWYRMFDLGIDAYISSLGDRLEQVFESYEDLHNPMAEAHRNLTVAIEDFYDLQASSYSIFYAMIDNFVATFEGSEGQIDEDLQQHVTYYTAKQDEVAEMLAPPEFQAITVTPNRPENNYFNETNISWSVSHPHGVIESAIQIESGGGTGSGLDIYYGLDQYRSTGTSQSVEVYLTRTTGLDITPQNIRSATHNTLDLNVGVRARGPAGTVAMRRAAFQVDVGPEGTGVPPGHNALPDQYQDTPPPPPIAELHKSMGYNTVVDSDGGETYSRNGLSFQLPSISRTYWTNNDQVITIQARAGDDITGISSFEYAVGSSPGEQDIIEWTLLAGVMTASSDGYQRIRGDSRFIGLEEGEEYYISLRATNGAGVTSAATHVEDPVRYENNPPANIDEDTFDDPLTTVLGYPLIIYATLGGPSVYDPVYHAPSGFHESFNPDDVNTEQRVNPKVAVTWTASSDAESGLSHYEYVVTSTPAVSEVQFADAPTTIEHHVIIEGGPGTDYEDVFDNFRDPVYVHVRAVDFAGNTSDILTMEQVAYDPRNPYAPIMQGQPGTDELRLYLTGPSYDPESGLKGIQYSVGTSPGSTNVISWPSGNEVNMAHTNAYMDSYLNPHTQQVMGQSMVVSGGSFLLANGMPYITIPAVDLPEGQQLYINYRAVNEQGHRSIVRSTGPVAIDNEAPLAHSVSRSFSFNHLISRIIANYAIEDIHDPVSGVIKVEVKATQGNDVDSGWSVIEEYDVARQGPFSLSGSQNMSLDFNNPDYITIWARVTNGVHLQTVKPVQIYLQHIDTATLLSF